MATEKTPPLLSMLQRLPPSKELLDFYHKKLEQYVDDEQRWMKRLASTKKAVDQSMNLEKEIFAQKREITALQKAVTDIREALAQERKINNKLYVENDKLRVRPVYYSDGGILGLPNVYLFVLTFQNLNKTYNFYQKLSCFKTYSNPWILSRHT